MHSLLRIVPILLLWALLAGGVSACGDEEASPTCLQSINCCKEWWSWRAQNHPDYVDLTTEGLAAEQEACEALGGYEDEHCLLMTGSLKAVAEIPEAERHNVLPACYP